MPPRAYVFLTAFLRVKHLKYASRRVRKREINENHILEDQSLIDYSISRQNYRVQVKVKVEATTTALMTNILVLELSSIH